MTSSLLPDRGGTCRALETGFADVASERVICKIWKVWVLAEGGTILGAYHFRQGDISWSGEGIDGERVGTATTPTEIHIFLGLAGYYKSFIRGFSKITGHLTHLTRKGVPFIWSDACQLAFNELKEKLTSALVLALPRPGVEYLVYIDASLKGLGGVLQ